jgi:hypothetical protein
VHSERYDIAVWPYKTSEQDEYEDFSHDGFM